MSSVSAIPAPRSAAQKARTLDVQGVQVFIKESGMGVPTLFLHGVPDSAEMWNPLIERLDGDFRCLAPDLPGLGRSVAPKNFDLSLENKARFVDALVSAAGVDQPLNLVLHDFGGHYGLAWAIRHPEKVRRLAISNTAFFADYRWHRNAQLWRTPLLGELSLAILTPGLFVSTMRKMMPGRSDEQIRAMYDLSIARPSVKKMILRLYRSANPQDFAAWEVGLKTLMARVPACVIWGDKDEFAAPALAGRFGAAKVYHFADYGHWVMAEAPDKVAPLLRQFFA